MPNTAEPAAAAAEEGARTMSLIERLKEAARKDWDAYTRHPFVEQLGAGTLPSAAFRRYFEQDYLFLLQFARARALAVYKARDTAMMRAQAKVLDAIVAELDVHVGLCQAWGTDAAALAALPEARETVSYTRFVLDEGVRGDLLGLLVVLAPCTVGYAEIGRRLAREVPAATAESNPYRKWVEVYASDEFQAGAASAAAELDSLAAQGLSQARFDELAGLFAAASRLEADFWQMGLNALC
eukprot:m51a1_g7938 hypothetical protein (240) ;mRNA; r:88289-89008